MDRIEKTVWLILASTLILFFVLSVGDNAYGEDRFEILRFAHPDNPSVCIMEPEPIIQDRFHEEIFKMTADSVLIWQNEMKQYSDGDWYMPIFYYEYEEHFDKTPEDFRECNIFMEFREYNTGEGEGTPNKKALGWTGFDFSKSWHKWSYVMTYLKSPEVNPHISLCIGCEDNSDISLELKHKDLPSDTINRIIMHEFGHALGIGHYIEDINSRNNLPSLMYPNLNPFKENTFEIEELDKEMLRVIYNDDGFGGLHGDMPYYYTIEVDDHGWRLK